MVKRIICNNCGKVFFNAHNRKYCSTDCYHKTPVWNKGKTYEELFGKERAEKIINKFKLKLPEKEIIELYKTTSTNEIARKFNCSPRTIAKILKKNNIKIRTPRETRRIMFMYNKLKIRKINLPEKKIIELYKNNSMNKISKIFYCGSTTIKKILEKNNIYVRTFGETKKLMYKLGKLKTKKLKLPEKEIIELYKNNSFLKELAIRFNCSSPTILRVLKENNIRIRSLSESVKLLFKSGKLKSPKLNLPEKEVIELYKNKKLSANEIGELFNCSQVPILRILKENNVFIKKRWNKGLTKKTDEKVRKYSDSLNKYYKENKNPVCGFKKGHIPWNTGLTKENDERIRIVSENNEGRTFSEETRRIWREQRKLEKHPNWRGGKSFEPYGIDFNKKLKRKIKERDGKCMLCKTNLLILKELKRKVDIHHTDYYKKNNFPQNLVTLCVNCHMLTNFDREKWKTFFQSLLKEEYGYQYTPDQKIILDFTKKE